MTSSRTSLRAGRIPVFRPVVKQVPVGRRSNLVTDRFAAGLRSTRELVTDLLARWTAPDRPNSITLSSSLAGRKAGRKPARELVREQDSIMESGLNRKEQKKRMTGIFSTGRKTGEILQTRYHS